MLWQNEQKMFRTNIFFLRYFRFQDHISVIAEHLLEIRTWDLNKLKFVLLKNIWTIFILICVFFYF